MDISDLSEFDPLASKPPLLAPAERWQQQQQSTSAPAGPNSALSTNPFHRINQTNNPFLLNEMWTTMPIDGFPVWAAAPRVEEREVLVHAPASVPATTGELNPFNTDGFGTEWTTASPSDTKSLELKGLRPAQSAVFPSSTGGAVNVGGTSSGKAKPGLIAIPMRSVEATEPFSWELKKAEAKITGVRPVVRHQQSRSFDSAFQSSGNKATSVSGSPELRGLSKHHRANSLDFIGSKIFGMAHPSWIPFAENDKPVKSPKSPVGKSPVSMSAPSPLSGTTLSPGSPGKRAAEEYKVAAERAIEKMQEQKSNTLPRRGRQAAVGAAGYYLDM